MLKISRSLQWRSEGGQGGHGPRAQALEGAPAQLVGVNFNGANAMGPELSRAPISLGVFFVLKTSPPPRSGCRIYQTGGGGGGRRSKHWPPGAGDPRDATGSLGHPQGVSLTAGDQSEKLISGNYSS